MYSIRLIGRFLGHVYHLQAAGCSDEQLQHCHEAEVIAVKESASLDTRVRSDTLI